MSESISPLWNLVSTVVGTIVGGGVTFITTYTIEKIKLKKELKLKHISTVLTPYCDSIEELLEKTKQFQINLETKQGQIFYKDHLNEFKVLRKGMNEVKNYSKVSKRLYFSKKTRRLLDDYCAEVDCFEELLRNDCARYQLEFSEYITPLLNRCITLGVAQHVSYSLNDSANSLLELAFLSKSPIALSQYISSVSYDEDVNCNIGKSAYFSFSGEEFLDCWYSVEQDQLDPKDIEDFDLRESCYLKLYINTELNDRNRLRRIILDTSYSQLLENQVKSLKEMNLQIIKEIDKL